jgi:hypothetical protein
MASVPHAREAGQAPALDLANPRAVFVWAVEAHEALLALATVAEDAIRPPRRRKLTRAAARALYHKARATMATLATVGVTPATTEPSAADARPRFEPWAE